MYSLCNFYLCHEISRLTHNVLMIPATLWILIGLSVIRQLYRLDLP